MRRRQDPLEPLIRSVYAYVAYRIGPGPDADDVTSETFERAFRYRASFDPARGETLPWLIGIARRCIAANLGTRLETTAEPPERASGGDVAEEVAARLDAVALVATLPDRDRELIALRYGADLTARQIAELLELKTNAVEVALHRALQRLRTEAVTGSGGEIGPIVAPRVVSREI